MGIAEDVLSLEAKQRPSREKWIVRLMPFAGEHPVLEPVGWVISCAEPVHHLSAPRNQLSLHRPAICRLIMHHHQQHLAP